MYLAVFVFLLVLLHLTLHLAFGMGAQAPDLMTVAVLLAARRVRGATAAGLGCVLGLVDDTLALTTFGASAVALTLIGYLAARSRDIFEGESLAYLLVYLFLGKWLRDGLTVLLTDRTLDGLASTVFISLPLLALYAAAAGVVSVVVYHGLSGQRT